MAEHRESGEPSVEPVIPSPGVAVALNVAKDEPTLADETREFLREQKRLTQLQSEQIESEVELHHWSMRVRHISDVMKLTFQTAGALLVLALVVGIAAAIWSAAHNKGLVIEAFSVPPDLAARGLTGEVIATQIQDKLSAMRAQTDSVRASSTYANDWTNDIKVQIPDTGVSIGELYRALAKSLGSQTRISGEIYRGPGGLSVSARAGGDGATFSGAESDLDKLVTQAAEHIYGATQPYLYVVYLGQHNRPEALDRIRALALNGPSSEKPWAYSRWGTYLQSTGDLDGALEEMRISAQLGPTLPHVFWNLASAEAPLGHLEAALKATQRSVALIKGRAAKQLAAYAVAIAGPMEEMILADTLGDYQAAIALVPRIEPLADYSESRASARILMSADLAQNHDIRASLSAVPSNDNNDAAFLKLYSGTNSGSFTSNGTELPDLQRAIALDDWEAVSSIALADERVPEASTPALARPLHVFLWPWQALAEAKLGNFAAAHELIDKTPLDCYLCVRMRARIFAEEKNWPQAEHWFEEASRQGRSLPFAETEWGAMLLANGNADGAIEKLKTATQKSPHFADPQEVWGEALMAKGDTTGAIAKFTTANQFAPKWGRLHMKWGEALAKSGSASEAQEQFALAATLDLSVADKQELAGELK